MGFNAHPDYKNAKDIFGDIEANACPVGYCFGKDGKPFYIRGPYEDQVKAQRIINTLQKKCGEDGFNYTVMLDGDLL